MFPKLREDTLEQSMESTWDIIAERLATIKTMLHVTISKMEAIWNWLKLYLWYFKDRREIGSSEEKHKWRDGDLAQQTDLSFFLGWERIEGG